MIHNRKTLLFGVVRQCHILQDPEVISQGPNFTAEIQNVIPEAVDVLKPIRGQAS
jgi:hypothetical protein|uniref:hypothetical protein n=1 Tax=Escherichia coli TaxID=562 RepID=UPI0040415EE5